MSKSLKRTKYTVGATFLIGLIAALFFSLQVRSSLGGSPPLQTAPGHIASAAANSVELINLGRALFEDVNLSNPPGLACSSCHGAQAGFKFPGDKVNKQSGIAPGAVKGRFENRIPPTVNYAAYLPTGPVQYSLAAGSYIGGLFWDGRANTLTDQAADPLQNPNEMNDTLHNVGDPALVVQKVQDGPNAYLLRQIYGDQVFSQSTTDVFNRILSAITSYERSPELSPFSSKYDAYVHGTAKLSASELNGLRLATGFVEGRPGGTPYYKSAHCVDCHGIQSDPSQGADLWTNSCYANIGVPKNPANPYYTMTNAKTNPAGYNPQGADYIDLGLGGPFYPLNYNLPPGNIGPGSNGEGDFSGVNGTFKAPTLRNVDKRPMPGFIKRYTHNGYFSDLKTLVHFYNTRNLTTVAGEIIDFTQDQPYANLKGTPLWPSPEYPNQNTLQNSNGAFNSEGAQVGNLGLTDAEENDVVAFLGTLSDGFTTPQPQPLNPPQQNSQSQKMNQLPKMHSPMHRPLPHLPQTIKR